MVTSQRKSKPGQKGSKEKTKKGNGRKRSSGADVASPQLGATDILTLQRLAGNRHVERMLALQRKQQQQEEEEKPQPTKSDRVNPFDTVQALIAYLLKEQIEDAADEHNVDPHLVAAIFAHESAEVGAFDSLDALDTSIVIPELLEGSDLIVQAWEWLTREGVGDVAFRDADADLLEERIESGQVIPAGNIPLGDIGPEITRMFQGEGLSPEEIAATLRAMIEQWKAAGVNLEGQFAILASLYGEGSSGTPNFSRAPKATTYGMGIVKAMLHMETLYGLDG